MDSAPQGVLLINLGTPDAPDTGAVRRYLREFLSDPRVLDIGSSALEKLRARGVRELALVPLYPQYASSSTGSSLEEAYRLVGAAWNVEALRVLPPFYDHPAFLDALADVGRPVLAAARAEHVLFSFHGLPERQVRKSDPTGAHCLARADCCDTRVPANRWCYRMQCFYTARELAQRLGLDVGTWTVTFQSRLGRTPWIRPYTDVVIPELAGKGVKRLAVFCPAFVADCLETLEEIGIRAKEQFLGAGGEALTLVPSLNTHPSWVRGLTRMLRELRGEDVEPGTAA
jgi:ferrochelatase